jgi:hypothetical protein
MVPDNGPYPWEKTETASPAEELREAARLMRERARAATPGRWHAKCSDGAYQDWYVVSSLGLGQVTTGLHDDGGDIVLVERDRADAEHIASWSPPVALAVADWLDDYAGWLEEQKYTMADLASHGSDPGIAVARACLGAAGVPLRAEGGRVTYGPAGDSRG